MDCRLLQRRKIEQHITRQTTFCQHFGKILTSAECWFLGQKTYFWTHFFLFLCNAILLSQRIHKYNKNEKFWFFLGYPLWYTQHTWILQCWLLCPTWFFWEISDNPKMFNILLTFHWQFQLYLILCEWIIYSLDFNSHVVACLQVHTQKGIFWRCFHNQHIKMNSSAIKNFNLFQGSHTFHHTLEYTSQSLDDTLLVYLVLWLASFYLSLTSLTVKCNIPVWDISKVDEVTGIGTTIQKFIDTKG